jgi:hypothetical protein
MATRSFNVEAKCPWLLAIVSVFNTIVFFVLPFWNVFAWNLDYAALLSLALLIASCCFNLAVYLRPESTRSDVFVAFIATVFSALFSLPLGLMFFAGVIIRANGL